MNPKALFHWFYEQGCNYNLFTLDENDYDDDDEPRDLTIVLRQQKYTTRLYVFLLMVSLYILFYTGLMRTQSQTMTISPITPVIFNKLYLDHGDTLSCPCSTVTVPYKNFVSNTIRFHSVCSSHFVSQQWIEALYLLNASRYGVTDFRTTANSQFRLLSSLCSFSQNTVIENKIDFENNEFVTIYLLSEVQVQSEVNVTVTFIKNSISIRTILFMNYMRTSTRANYLVSALNTNVMTLVYKSGSEYQIRRLETRYPSDKTSTEIIVCGSVNPTSPAGFFSTSNLTDVFDHAQWFKPISNSILVNGFFGGCTPLEALLQSTLDCLYQIKCLQLLTNYFPALNQMKFNWTDVILSSKQENVTVNDYMNNLFIEEWSIKINYSNYFNQCAPSFCTYTTIDHINLSYAITLFISLYGGLIMTLRLIAPLFINIYFKFKHWSININVHKFTQSLKRLNLFKTADDKTENTIKKQKMITYVYLMLLTGSFLVLVIFTWLNTEIVTITVPKPSLITYNNIEVLYSKTLRCPCSTMTIPNNIFISLSPTLHEICSSDFVSDRWMSIIREAIDWTTIDWRNKAYSQFQLLSNLCQLANKTIDDAVHHFLLQSFIASNVLSEIDFNTQLNSTLNQFFQSIIISFNQLINTVSLLTQVDQPYMGSLGNYWRTALDENLIGNIVTNITNNQQSLQVKFVLRGTHNIYSTFVNCICATNPNCQSPVVMYNIDHAWHTYRLVKVEYIVPGSIEGCSNFNSLMLSTLECLYSNTDCFPILINYIKQTYIQNVEYPSWFDIHPLNYDPTFNRFPPKTLISTIISEIMIERWNSSFSYKNFYEFCAPNYCIYSERMRTNTIIGVMITLLSMIGGLTVSLRLFTPHFIKFIFILFTKIVNRQQQQQEEQSVGLTKFNQVKKIVQSLSLFLYNTLINLNIFSLRNFDNNLNRMRAKRLGQWSTRLYIILFLIGLVILILYTIIQPQIVTKIFDKPSFNVYNQLKQDYGEKLKCSCSKIASSYDQFIKIEPIFHQICSSSFVSEEWRINLTIGLVSNLSVYEQRDYRRFLSAHLQFLNGFCQISNESIINSIKQFYSTLFVTTQLLSENYFYDRIFSLIEQSKSNVPKIFSRLFFLIRNINHGNGIISKYGTNFEYISPWYTITNSYLPTQPIIYDDGCSCGLYSNCTIQANFIKRNSSLKIPIKGLKMGCTPSESFLLSNLECFYDQLCLNLIQEYTNYKNDIIPLENKVNQFLINTTIIELIDNLFVEQWLTTMNYSSYFQQCLPLFCSYNQIQQLNLFYIITVLLGLQGGLTIVLKWISPKIVQILDKIYQNQKKRIVDINVISHLESRVPTERRLISTGEWCLKIILSCIFILIVMTGLIIFSIYIAQIQNNDTILTTSSTSMTTSTIINTITTTITSTSIKQLAICQSKFQVMTRYKTGSSAGLKSPIAADFNGDNRSDIAFFNYQSKSIHVLLGNGNGTFKIGITSLGGSFGGWILTITTGDFNRDNQLDLAFVNTNVINVTIMFGNGNGTFRTPTKLYTGSESYPTGITISDFNGDNYLDIAVANNWDNNIGIFLGKGDGNFSTQMTYYTGRNSYPFSISTADFNGDGYQDIAVSNTYTRNIGIYLGYGNGTFQQQRSSFTGGYFYPYFIVVADFNSDLRSDIVFSYDSGGKVGVLFGYGNGTLGELAKFISANTTYYPKIAVGDFNNDNHLDITVSSFQPYIVYVLFGYGNGNFEAYTIFPTGLSSSYSWMGVADFNGDGCQDILASDSTAGSIDILLNKCECLNS